MSKRLFDIKHQKIEELTPLEREEEGITTPRSFDFKQASITLVLAIVALWSAYFITRLLNKTTVPSTAVSTSTDKTTTTETPPATPGQAEEAPATQNPFAPISNDSTKPSDSTKDTATDTTKEIAKDSFNIRILNGNGIVGDAAKLKSDLVEKGFKVGTTGNAKLKYTKTQVNYIAGKQKEAELVAQNLAPRQTEVKEADAGLVGSGFEVLIVTGKE